MGILLVALGVRLEYHPRKKTNKQTFFFEAAITKLITMTITFFFGAGQLELDDNDNHRPYFLRE